LRKECRLRVFENRVLRRIFGPNRDEVTAEWSRLYNEELCVLYSTPNIIRVIKSSRIEGTGHVAHMGYRRGAYMVLEGRPEGGRPPGRPSRRREDNIKLKLEQMGWGHILFRSGSV
jgi:hypothetical protein